jgi:hypothetical protein
MRFGPWAGLPCGECAAMQHCLRSPSQARSSARHSTCLQSGNPPLALPFSAHTHIRIHTRRTRPPPPLRTQPPSRTEPDRPLWHVRAAGTPVREENADGEASSPSRCPPRMRVHDTIDQPSAPQPAAQPPNLRLQRMQRTPDRASRPPPWALPSEMRVLPACRPHGAWCAARRLHGETYSFPSDVWALGLCVIECITGASRRAGQPQPARSRSASGNAALGWAVSGNAALGWAVSGNAALGWAVSGNAAMARAISPCADGSRSALAPDRSRQARRGGALGSPPLLALQRIRERGVRAQDGRIRCM